MSWHVSNVSFRHAGSADYALKGISLEIPKGQFTAVVGPNGAGKSSLLNVLLGTRKAELGTVTFHSLDVRKWNRVELSKEIGVVAQSEEVSFPLSARDMVAMGRYPHLGPWKRERAEDRRVVREVMECCDVWRFAERDINTLSGGERQRVRIARALAQQPTTLALDEPTAALDVAHEMSTFELLRDLTRNGMTVMLITHHINLAARYADRIAVLHNGQVASVGSPASVLTAELVEKVWQWPMLITPHQGPGADYGAVQVTPLSRGAG